MIEAKEINFAYRRGIPVLFDINCKIEDGEFVALLGHNGSGKTTLSRLFMALEIMNRPTWRIKSDMCSRTRICRFWQIRCMKKLPMVPGSRNCRKKTSKQM